MANLDTPIYGAIGIYFCTEIQLSNRYLTHHLSTAPPTELYIKKGPDT